MIGCDPFLTNCFFDNICFLIAEFVSALFLFFFTDPVPEPCDQSKKKAVAQVPKKLKKDHLKIDWSGLKISQEQLENLSKIEIHALSEQATLSAAAGKNLKDAVKGARSKA